jgi:hypothetical protein
MRTRTAALVATLATIICLSAPRVASAAPQYISLMLTPIRAEIVATPGATVSTDATLTSTSADTQTITYTAVDFVAADETGKPRLVKADQSPWSMSSWVRVVPNAFVLAPFQSKLVHVFIDVPAKAEPGGHYAAAMLGTMPGAGRGAKVSGRVGELLLLTVRGDLRMSGTESLDLDWLHESGPVSMTVRFHNTGNVHVKPAGSVRITQLWGAKLAEIPISAENVLPDSIRATPLRWDNPPYGVFFAQAIVHYGESDLPASSARQLVVVLPWRLILVGIALFVLGWGLPASWRWLRRRGKRRTASAASASAQPGGEPGGE